MKEVNEGDLKKAQESLGIKPRMPANLIDWDSIIQEPIEDEPAIMAGVGLERKESK